MNLRQSKEFAYYMKLSGWLVETIDNCHVYIRKFPFLPPLIMKIQYSNPPIPFEKIEQLIKKYKPLQVQIQSLKYEVGLEKYKYHLSRSSGHVTKTIQLDLTQSEKKILGQMRKDARYGIRKTEKEALQIIKVVDLARFHQAWRKSVSWRIYIPSSKTLKHLKKAFGQKAIFLVATAPRYNDIYHHSKILAGNVILTTNDSAYYYYAFTSKEGREKFAQYLLVWEAIKLVKKRGCKIFDFEGIYDERSPQKSWLGFSHFKKSFGGKEVEYPGSFIKFYNPILKFISKLPTEFLLQKAEGRKD